MTKIIKKILLMELHSINRGTNYILAICTYFGQFCILSVQIKSGEFTIQEQINMIVESMILCSGALILFFVIYSPIREYVQRNWEEVNTCFTRLILMIKSLWK